MESLDKVAVENKRERKEKLEIKNVRMKVGPWSDEATNGVERPFYSSLPKTIWNFNVQTATNARRAFASESAGK